MSPRSRRRPLYLAALACALGAGCGADDAGLSDGGSDAAPVAPCPDGSTVGSVARSCTDSGQVFVAPGTCQEIALPVVGDALCTGVGAPRSPGSTIALRRCGGSSWHADLSVDSASVIDWSIATAEPESCGACARWGGASFVPPNDYTTSIDLGASFDAVRLIVGGASGDGLAHVMICVDL